MVTNFLSNAPRVLSRARDVTGDLDALAAPQAWIVNGARGIRHSPAVGAPRQSKCRDFVARDSLNVEYLTFDQALEGRYCDACAARQVLAVASAGQRALEPLMAVSDSLRMLRNSRPLESDVIDRWMDVESTRRLLAELDRLSHYEMPERSRQFVAAAVSELEAIQESLRTSIASDWHGLHESSVMASLSQLHRAPSWLVTPSELLVLNDNEPQWMSDRGVPSAYAEWISCVQQDMPRDERRHRVTSRLTERDVTDVRQLANVDPRTLARELMQAADDGDVDPTIAAITRVWRLKLTAVADQIVSRWELLRDELLTQDSPTLVALSLRPDDADRLFALAAGVFTVAQVAAPEGYWSSYLRVVVRVPESTAHRLLELTETGRSYNRGKVEVIEGDISMAVAETALALWEPWEGSSAAFNSFASALASARALVDQQSLSPAPVEAESPVDQAAARRITVAAPTSSHAVSRFV